MFAIIGLGNPGPKYSLTRHNIGFMLVDCIVHAFQAPPYKNEHKALVTKVNIENQPVLLVKPQTFMNLSGQSVQSITSYYNIKLENLLVAHDEIEIPFGHIRYQQNRGHGGHNGVRNIHQLLGTNSYKRLRLGVGRPSNPSMEVADFVLQNFNKQESIELSTFLEKTIDSIEVLLKQGFDKASTLFNGNILSQ